MHTWSVIAVFVLQPVLLFHITGPFCVTFMFLLIMYKNSKPFYPRGLNHLFRRIFFSVHGHSKWFLKNCISFLWSEEIIVIGYKFALQFYGEYFCLPKCNILFNNEHLIIIWFFLLIENELDLKIALRKLNPENHQEY